MRTTVELPDDLLTRAKHQAALGGISLKEFFIQSIEMRLAANKKKVRRPPPVIGSPGAPAIRVLTPEQIEEAMFGS